MYEWSCGQDVVSKHRNEAAPLGSPEGQVPLHLSLPRRSSAVENLGPRAPSSAIVYNRSTKDSPSFFYDYHLNIMASNPITELASTLQSTSIKRHPSPHHDVNPSTAISTKALGTATVHSPSSSLKSATTSSDRIPSDIADEVSLKPRRSTLPPLPDLRFEQSYLASIKNADTWGKVAYITIRDQVMMPLTQGIVWNLLLFGWRNWNRGAKFSGQTLGSRVRRWWWGVNNWELPKADLLKETKRTLAGEVKDVRHSTTGAFWDFMGRG